MASSFAVVVTAALLILAAHPHACFAKHKPHHPPPPPPTPTPTIPSPPPPPPTPTPPLPPPASTNASSNSTSTIPVPGGGSGNGTSPVPGGGSGNGTSTPVDGGGWQDARATWYGAPNGAGPEDNGGACGFKKVNMPPFSAMTSCGNEPLFRDGKGCGSCYQIRCVSSVHPACSGVAETVVITDMNYYPVAHYHLDLSGTAFGAMAKDNRNEELRHAGIINIKFRRVACQYPGLTVTFHVQPGSNPNYLAILVEYENGDGDVQQVDLMESTGSWEAMRESWGSIWRYDTARAVRGPFSLRITNESGKTLVADQVIPADWAPDTVYSSLIQFD